VQPRGCTLNPGRPGNPAAFFVGAPALRLGSAPRLTLTGTDGVLEKLRHGDPFKAKMEPEASLQRSDEER
jgi:hypothetical protein